MISFAVSTVPGREAACASVVAQLPPERTTVYVDDPPSGGSWSNYRRALEGVHAGASWLVSVDDDARLTRDFPVQVRRALATCPGDFASFYCSYAKTVSKARADGASWMKTIRVVHGIAFAIRPHLAREVIDVATRLVRPAYYSGDQRLLAWLAHTKRYNYVSIPNLVDHRSDLMSSIFPDRANAARHSALFAEDVSGVTWTGKTYDEGLRCAASTMRTLAVKGALLSMQNVK